MKKEKQFVQTAIIDVMKYNFGSAEDNTLKIFYEAKSGTAFVGNKLERQLMIDGEYSNDLKKGLAYQVSGAFSENSQISSFDISKAALVEAAGVKNPRIPEDLNKGAQKIVAAKLSAAKLG